MQQLQHKLGDYTILSNGGTLNRDRMGTFNNQMQGEVDMFGRQVGYRQPPFQNNYDSEGYEEPLTPT